MRSLDIVTTGLAATFPFGGVFWDYMQYPLGFQRMGHRVLYLEEPALWCYDPVAETYVAGGASNAAWFARQVERLDPELARSWCYRDFQGATYGVPFEEAKEFCRNADLFLNVSGSALMHEEYFECPATVFLDSDPMYTQSWVGAYERGELTGDLLWKAEQVRKHKQFFTFAENIGRPDCAVPTALFDWKPTRQPIVIDAWRGPDVEVPLESRRKVLTTVLSWEPREGTIEVGGRTYHGKSHELLRFLDLPARSALPLELALSGPAPVARIEASGFRVRKALEVSRDPWLYRDYLARSAGEWSVAKHAYVASRSGWSSCRTACYLALGVPAVVEDTGFSRLLPVGEGLLTFTDVDSAVAAIAALAAEPERHAAAARRVAEQSFDARVVLGDLLERALGPDARGVRADGAPEAGAASGARGGQEER